MCSVLRSQSDSEVDLPFLCAIILIFKNLRKNSNFICISTFLYEIILYLEIRMYVYLEEESRGGGELGEERGNEYND